MPSGIASNVRGKRAKVYRADTPDPGLPAAVRAGGLGGIRLYRSLATLRTPTVPATRVRRGDVTLTVTAKAELRGGNSKEFAAAYDGRGSC